MAAATDTKTAEMPWAMRLRIKGSTVEETIATIKANAPSHKFGVMKTYALHEEVKADGDEAAATADVLEVCSPPKAAVMLGITSLAVIGLPCRMAVTADGDDTIIAMVDPASIYACFDNTELLAASKGAAEAWFAMLAGLFPGVEPETITSKTPTSAVIVTETSEQSLDEVLAGADAVIEAAGGRKLHFYDVRAVLQSKGLDFDIPVNIFEVWPTGAGAKALAAYPDSALALPVRFCLIEQDKKTTLAAYDFAGLTGPGGAGKEAIAAVSAWQAKLLKALAAGGKK